MPCSQSPALWLMPAFHNNWGKAREGGGGGWRPGNKGEVFAGTAISSHVKQAWELLQSKNSEN